MATVLAYPFASICGDIDIPDDVDDVEQYVIEHWNEIVWGEPELDYCGTDFEVEE